MFAGPPCESWTAARHNQIDIADKKKLPRQIRSAKELWGIEGLSRAERYQVIIGNDLLPAAFSTSFEVYRAGGVCPIERPDWPHWINEPATIWRTRAALTLFELDGITVTSFNQCVMGALGKKTTR